MKCLRRFLHAVSLRRPDGKGNLIPTEVEESRCTILGFAAGSLDYARNDDRSTPVTSSQTLPPHPMLRLAGPVRIGVRDPDTSWPGDRPDKIPGSERTESWPE